MKFLNNLALHLVLLWQFFGVYQHTSFAMSKWEWEYALRVKVLASVEEKMKELAFDPTQGSSRQQLATLDQLKHRLMRGLHFSLSGLVQQERDTLHAQLKLVLEQYREQLMYYRETQVLITILERL